MPETKEITCVTQQTIWRRLLRCVRAGFILEFRQDSIPGQNQIKSPD